MLSTYYDSGTGMVKMKRHVAFWWWNRTICNLCQSTTGWGNNYVSVGDNLPTNPPKHPYCSEQLMETMLWTSVECPLTTGNRTEQHLRPVSFSQLLEHRSTNGLYSVLNCLTFHPSLLGQSPYVLYGKWVKLQLWNENHSLNTITSWHQNCFLCPIPFGTTSECWNLLRTYNQV